MEEDIFSRLMAQEEAGEEEIEAYADNYPDSEGEPEEEYPEEEYPEDEPEFMSAIHHEQVGVGQQTRKGESRLEKAIRAAELGKEGVYLQQTLRPVMIDIFTRYDLSENLVNGYIKYIELDIPRFWVKNPKAISIAIILIRQLKNVGATVPTMKMIEALAKQNAIHSSDIYRYYKLLKKYNIN